MNEKRSVLGVGRLYSDGGEMGGQKAVLIGLSGRYTHRNVCLRYRLLEKLFTNMDRPAGKNSPLESGGKLSVSL